MAGALKKKIILITISKRKKNFPKTLKTTFFYMFEYKLYAYFSNELNLSMHYISINAKLFFMI